VRHLSELLITKKAPLAAAAMDSNTPKVNHEGHLYDFDKSMADL